MTDTTPRRTTWAGRFLRSGLGRAAVAAILLAAALVCGALLESRFNGLEVTGHRVGETPVTIYRPAGEGAGEAALPLIVVAHGFGGSRQMMDQIAVTLARSGFSVASFDFPGHGRNPVPLSPDVTVIEGTTAQLVDNTLAVTRAILARPDVTGPVSFVGHSMATDVIVRASGRMDDVGAVAAISMYSEAVTADAPRRLIVVTGAREAHLRAVALEALREVDPEAAEGETASAGDIARRAVVAPRVGHVGVLYSHTTLTELADWITDATGHGAPGRPDGTGIAAGILLAALALLAWPLSTLLPGANAAPRPEVPRGAFLAAIALPVPPALAAALVVPGGIGPAGGFAPLTTALAVWGGVQMLWLWRRGVPILRPDAIATLAVLAWGLGVFAIALDRYGAAFLPTGPRAPVMALLLAGTLPLMAADAALTAGAPVWRRLAARLVLVLTLAGAMGLAPLELGLTFTVLPVLVLFFLVYGSFARWAAARRGPGAAWPALGIALAWALAASTPLFAT